MIAEKRILILSLTSKLVTPPSRGDVWWPCVTLGWLVGDPTLPFVTLLIVIMNLCTNNIITMHHTLKNTMKALKKIPNEHSKIDKMAL